MKHLVPVIVLVACAATAARSSETTDAEQIIALQQTLVAAYIQRDASVLQRVLADDYIFTQDSGAVDTKVDVLRSFATGGDRTVVSYVIRESRVKLYGDAAVLNYAYKSSETYKGRSEGGDFRVTRVFIRMNGAWRIVAGQETRIAAAPAGK